METTCIGGVAVAPAVVPAIDPGFLPAYCWNAAYRQAVAASGCPAAIGLALARPDGTCFVHHDRILPHTGSANRAANVRYVERLLKFLLWQKGGSRIALAGCPELAAALARLYAPGGARAFDHALIGRKVFGEDLVVSACAAEELPAASEPSIVLGRHLDGCRVGFDLGGSDRKCAAVIDGRVVFSEEVTWSPYFEKDPQYHFDGIDDSIRRAAAHLPRVDAIGGSAAGVYVNNEPRVGSLFRGVSDADFAARVRPLFRDLRRQWNNVPFEVVNDGEVTALAGSMALRANAVLGIAMGTSEAAGYCDPQGHITTWLNELAFVPIDYRADAPVDEWSGDAGCGVQYFSQQAVARLAPAAGIPLPAAMPLPEQLAEVRRRMDAGDPRAARIYEAIGIYLGYAIAHHAEFYTICKLMIMGRVTSGAGGEVIVQRAQDTLRQVAPALAGTIDLVVPDEQQKRHGQAVAAASLPAIP